MRIKHTGKTVEKPDMLGVLIGKLEGRTVRVSAGFTEEERRSFARIGYDLAGRRAEVEAMERTDSGALRHPRFRRWRYAEEG